MAGEIYRKPIAFALTATVVVLVGTVVTMAYPMLRPEMHPRLESLKPFTALQLAGRDVYQREGCHNCHTQTVRPLKSEVLRYGDYSKAGEFAYDRPFLWGSKRTGPDLAREGGKRPDAWHRKHFASAQSIEPRSNMPAYAFLERARLDPATIRVHMDALGFPSTGAEIQALAAKTEMDALVAYMQVLGTAVPRRGVPAAATVAVAAVNPRGDSPQAIARGHQLFADNCAVCHGEEGHGQPDLAPSVTDDVFLGEKGDLPDGAYYILIDAGSDAKAVLERKGSPEGGMAPFGGQLKPDDIWSIVSWIRAQQVHEAKEKPALEAIEHQRRMEKK
jgi:cytochrome c oxidase cbb3-type subunit 2